MTNDAVIVGAVRTPVGKARKGGLATVRPDEMSATVIKELLNRTPNLEPAEIEDVVFGCAFPEGEQGMNIARMISLRAGLPDTVPAETINRYCSSGVQSIAHVAYAMKAGDVEVGIAGGVESMSMVPMMGYKFSPNPHFAQDLPHYYTNMGLTAENVSIKYGISREEQDEFALKSNQKATHAVETGLFDPELIPIDVELNELGADEKPVSKRFTVKRDEGPRGDSTIEALSKLKPAFKEGGTVTAGNSSQMSDGAAAVMVMSMERAAKLGLAPLARFVTFAVGGVPPELMGIGPIAAIPKALKQAGLTMNDIDLFELNEAFAAQSLAVMRTLEMDQEKVNVNGGAIALGHPLGCTGAKLTTQLIYEMGRRKSKYGMVTMCIGGGMGAAAVFENLQKLTVGTPHAASLPKSQGEQEMPLTIDTLMSKMPGAFIPEKAAGLDATIQFKFTGAEPGEWYATIKDGKCDVAQGTYTSPKMTLTADSNDYVKIFTGEIDGMKAFMEGKLKLAGDLNLAMKLTQMFKIR